MKKIAHIIILSAILTSCGYKVEREFDKVYVVREPEPLTEEQRNDTLISGLIKQKPFKKTKQRCDHVERFTMYEFYYPTHKIGAIHYDSIPYENPEKWNLFVKSKNGSIVTTHGMLSERTISDSLVSQIKYMCINYSTLTP